MSLIISASPPSEEVSTAASSTRDFALVSTLGPVVAAVSVAERGRSAVTPRAVRFAAAMALMGLRHGCCDCHCSTYSNTLVHCRCVPMQFRRKDTYFSILMLQKSPFFVMLTASASSADLLMVSPVPLSC